MMLVLILYVFFAINLYFQVCKAMHSFKYVRTSFYMGETVPAAFCSTCKNFVFLINMQVHLPHRLLQAKEVLLNSSLLSPQNVHVMHICKYLHGFIQDGDPYVNFASLMTFSSANLNSRHAKASLCRTLLFMGRGSESSTWILIRYNNFVLT